MGASIRVGIGGWVYEPWRGVFYPKGLRQAEELAYASGVLELKSKLGPLVWQFAPTKKFDVEDFAAFLALLPQRLDGRSIRHAVEVRHESFLAPTFIDLLRKHSVAPVLVDSEMHPMI